MTAAISSTHFESRGWLPRLSARHVPVAATIIVWLLLMLAGSIHFTGFFAFQNLIDLLRGNAFLGIAAVGMTFVILSGGIDLSVGAMIGFTSVLIGSLMTEHGWPAPAAIALALMIGSLFGAFMGLLIAFVELPPFLVTLAGMFFARGMGFVIHLGTIPIESSFYTSINNFSSNYFPVIALLFLGTLAAGIYIAHQTRFGRAVYAIGGSEQSAILMGVPVKWTKVRIYALSGFCAALAGVVFTLNTPSGDANAGTMLELDAIAVVVIGGTQLTGGVGYIFGTLMGVLILSTIQSLVTFQGSLNSWWAKIATYALLLVFILLQKFVEWRVSAARKGRRVMSSKLARQARQRGMISLRFAGVLFAIGLVAIVIWTWQATRPPRPDGKTQLVVWNLLLMGPSIDLALHQFEVENPEYKVVYSASVSPDTASDGQRLLTAIAGGVPPDLMLFDRFAIPEWASRNALTELRPLIEKQKAGEKNLIKLDEYYPWTVDEGSYRRPGSNDRPGIFGVPATIDCRLLFCNANQMRQVGMVDPKTGQPRPPSTWEELRDLANKLTIRDPASGVISRLGFAPNVGNSWLYMFAWQAGGELLSADGTHVTFDTAPVRRALRFMVDLFDDLGGAAKVNAFESSFQEAGPLDPFLTGSLSMKIDTTSALQLMINWKPDMDFLTSPAPNPADRLAAGEKPITWSGGYSFIIPANAQQTGGGFKLMQFLASPRIRRMLQQADREAMAAEGRLYLPIPHPNRKYFEEMVKQWVTDDPTVPPRIKEAYAVIQSMLPVARIRPPSPIGQVLWNQHVRAMDSVINHTFADQCKDKDSEVQHSLATYQVDAQAQLDAFLSPPPPREVGWSRYFWAYGGLIVITGIAMLVAYRRNRKSHGYRSREVGAALVFASPWLIGFVCLTGGPIIFSVVASFTRYDVLNPARYTGLENYKHLFNDDIFYKSLGNTAFMIIRLPIVMLVGLLIAMMLNRSMRGMGAFRTAFFIPSIVPIVAASLLWWLMLNPNIGAVNLVISWIFSTTPMHWLQLLCGKVVGHSVEFSPPNWLYDAKWSKPSLILMSVWAAGGGMIIWLAGLQSIPRQLYEAAEIDGANAWGQFKNVTLPMLSPYILFNAIVGLIATMQIFTEAYIMTQGGPADSTLFYAYDLFRNAFQYFRMGYASALAWILFAIVLALTVIQLWASKRWVHYDRA